MQEPLPHTRMPLRVDSRCSLGIVDQKKTPRLMVSKLFREAADGETDSVLQ